MNLKHHIRKTLHYIFIFFCCQLFGQNINCIATANHKLYAGTNEGVYILNEDGTKWGPKNKGIEITNVSCIAASGSSIFIGTASDGIFVSHDNGETWTAPENQMALQIKRPGETTKSYTKVYTINIIGSSVFIGAEKREAYEVPGLFRSVDNGKTWQPCMEFEKISVQTLAGNPDAIYAGTQFNGLYFSSDAGTTWKKMKTNKNLKSASVESIAVSGSTIFITTTSNAYSLDKGATWSAPEYGTIMYSNAFDNVYSNCGEDIFIAAKNTVLFSKKGSINWDNYSDGLEYGKITAISSHDTMVYVVQDEKLYSSSVNYCKWELAIKRELKHKAANDSINAMYEKLDKYKDEMYTPIMNYFKGMAEIEYGNYEVAITKFDEAIKIKPDFLQAIQARAECYKKLNNSQKENENSALFQKVKSTEKKEDLYTRAFNEKYEELNEKVKTKTSLYHLECYYKDEAGWVMKAEESNDEYKIKYLSEAIALNNKNDSYYIKRGNVFERINNLESAMQDYNYANSLNPSNPRYRINTYEQEVYKNCSKCQGTGYVDKAYIETQATYNKPTGTIGVDKHKTGYTSEEKVGKVRCTAKGCIFAGQYVGKVKTKEIVSELVKIN